jgi:hypothetical protein
MTPDQEALGAQGLPPGMTPDEMALGMPPDMGGMPPEEMMMPPQEGLPQDDLMAQLQSLPPEILQMLLAQIEQAPPM